MKVIFSPQKSNTDSIISLDGDLFKYDNETVALSTINDEYEAEGFRIIKNANGEITIKVLWRYTKDTILNRFPPALLIIEDGIIEPKDINNTQDVINLQQEE